jgi:formiminotetrahydrofolate cyclodeaminase
MKFETLFEWVKQQGFSIAILCMAIYWFNQKYDAQQEQINNLNTYIRTEMRQVIENDAKAFVDFKNALENLNNK